MKYFTRSWHSGDFDDKTANEIASSYRQVLEDISRTMPLPIKQLATEIDVHDAIIERVVVGEAGRKLSISLVAGDRSVGYYGVEIAYERAQIKGHDLDILKRRARDRSTCILYQEIDREKNGRYVQRILFWPEDEIEISFDNIRLLVTSREGRCVELVGYFVEEHDE